MYEWEMELLDKSVHKQFSEDGSKEFTWKDLPADSISRVTFKPKVAILPTHTLFIDHREGERFVRRFARGFIKTGEGGIHLREYVNCIVTNKYRFWLFSTGKVLLTNPKYELYI